MSRNKKIALAAFVLFVIFQIFMFTLPSITLRNIRSEFKGVIVDSAFNKTPKFTILHADSTLSIVEGASDRAFYKEWELGDTLIKYKDDVYCYLHRPNGFKKKYLYVLILDRERAHFLWPKEWVNKWPEASR